MANKTAPDAPAPTQDRTPDVSTRSEKPGKVSQEIWSDTKSVNSFVSQQKELQLSGQSFNPVDGQQFTFGSEGDFARLYNFAPQRDGKLKDIAGEGGAGGSGGGGGGGDQCGDGGGDCKPSRDTTGDTSASGESAKGGDATGKKGDGKGDAGNRREREVDEQNQADPAKKQEKKPEEKAEKDKPSEKDKPAQASDANREISPEVQKRMQELGQKFDARDGVDAARAREFQQNLDQAAQRIKDNPYIKDPSAEMDRIVGAMDRVLSSDGKVDGKQVHSAEDQNKIVEGLARRSANPEKNVNQGAHNTCPMESKARQVLETNPADYCETVASVATTGKAMLGPEGDKRETKVHTDSLRLDREARNMGPNSDGKRDGSGQLFDLAAAQSYWDTQSGPGGRYEYRQGSNPGQGETGESLVKIDGNGNEKVVGDNAMLTAHRVAEMSYRVDGDQGVFAHTSLAVGGRLNNFSNAQELQEKMEAYQKETGRPAQMLVFAGNLPGQAGRSSGHDLHAMTAWTKDGKFYGDNQWGTQSDAEVQGMNGNQIIAATATPDRTSGPSRPYDDIPPDQRIVDPGNSIDKEDRAPQKNKMDEDAEKLRKEEEDKRRQEQAIREQKAAAAFQDAHSRWTAAKKQAEADGTHFDQPEPMQNSFNN